MLSEIERNMQGIKDTNEKRIVGINKKMRAQEKEIENIRIEKETMRLKIEEFTKKNQEDLEMIERLEQKIQTCKGRFIYYI